MSKKMSNFTFRAVWIPIISALCAIMIGLTVAASVYADSLDTYLGRGARRVEGGDLKIDKEDLNYYEQKYATVDEARAGAYEISRAVSDAGIVLLKNDGLLPLKKKAKVSPLGYSYLNPVYGGVGSGNVNTTKDYVYTAERAFGEYFEINAAVVNAMKAATPLRLSGDGVGWVEGGLFPVKQEIDYYPASVFTSAIVASSMSGSVGIVFVGRNGGEGSDLYTGRKRTGYSDGTAHQLQLTSEELKTIAAAKKNCDGVVLIVNSSNVMELSPVVSGEYEVNAILHVPGPGASGFESLARILTGEVDPTGRTVDIWTSDFTADPTYVNFGDYTYADADIKYIEYEEGVYLGYRYYETVHEEGGMFTVRGEKNKTYDEAVVFPFGYGLSYDGDKVTQKLGDVTLQNGIVTVSGSVENKTAADVKATVQVYWGAPYVALERAAKNLVQFDRVEVKAGKTEQFELSFPLEDMCSYDYLGVYSSGKGSYVLEEGDYDIYLGKDSHNAWGVGKVHVDSTRVYLDSGTPSAGGVLVGKRLSDDVEATNRFGKLGEYMKNTDMLTRGNGLANSSVSAPAGEYESSDYNAAHKTDKKAGEEIIGGVKKFDPYTDKEMGNDALAAKAPVEKAANGLAVSQMRGEDFDSPAWDDLLDQINYEASDLLKTISSGAYNTGEIAAVGKQKTDDKDGPQGLTTFMGDLGTMAWTSEVMLASSFDKDLAREMGGAVGEEALTIGVSGWYAPAVNLHRSPFSGRNFEYYSEDPYLSGSLATCVTEGAMKKGLYVYLKHFAVNDQETNRIGIATWLTEQALRELYLKPFELCVKNATCDIKYIDVEAGGTSYAVKTKTIKATTGIMTSFNRIGYTWAAGNKALLTGVARGEWGFRGLVETDMGGADSLDEMLRAGCNIFMTFGSGGSIDDVSSNAFKQSVRAAVKNILYTYVNSNAMQGVAPGGKVVYAMSPWLVGLVCADAVVFAGSIAVALWMVWRTFDEKKYPHKYERKEMRR